LVRRLVHNHDTSMRILSFEREPDDSRTGLFTSGIVSVLAGHRIAACFTGRQHAGENLADLLRRRAAELTPPIQMCDALSRNAPASLRVILANCLAHGRRHFVELVKNFPAKCRYVLETLREVFHFDALALEFRSWMACTSGAGSSSRNAKWSRTRAWAKPSNIC
jgi:transposase